MKTIRVVRVLCLCAMVGACASDPGAEQPVRKWQASEAAQKLIEEKGQVTASMRGYDDDTDLVCEEWQKAGSHLKERFCYTREEYEKMQLNHQETMRKVIDRGVPRGGQ